MRKCIAAFLFEARSCLHVCFASYKLASLQTQDILRKSCARRGRVRDSDNIRFNKSSITIYRIRERRQLKLNRIPMLVT